MSVSTQISYWLIENGFTVLIAACDTFRAGAVEQLRTHQRRLNSLHPPEKHGGRPVVQLYEKGYGKDAAGIAMEAIAYGSSVLCFHRFTAPQWKRKLCQPVIMNITNTVKTHVHLVFPPARNQAFDVVLVDTAGRMQDNAPLMTALAKLIAVNMPDLVLFVGEALVGNEAVDQLVRPPTDCDQTQVFMLLSPADFGSAAPVCYHKRAAACEQPC